MYQNETNEYGCPLCDQSGAAGVQNFDAIIARLAPDLRAAFEAERAACQAELDRYLAAGTSTSGSLQLELIAEIAPLTHAAVLIMRFEQLLAKLGRPRLRELIDNLLPRIARSSRLGRMQARAWRVVDPRSSFRPVVRSKAAYHGRKKNSCGAGYTFPTAFMSMRSGPARIAETLLRLRDR